jgi:catechol 2,3-dioxygenase
VTDIATPTRGRARQLGHVVLYVADIERSTRFYRDVLGWPVAAAHDRLPAVAFRASDIHHDLLLIEVGPGAQPIPKGRRVGVYHIGINVGSNDDDLRAVLARLQAHPDLATIHGLADHTITHSLYVLDPDGNELELYVDIPGINWRDPALLLASTGKPLRL